MPHEPLRIEDLPSSEAGRRVLRLGGPLLINNLFEFQSAVRADSSSALFIDLSGVPYIDSAGVGCLVGAYVSRQNSGRSLALVGVNERVLNTLKIAHVDSFFRYLNSLADAEKAVS